MQTLFVLFFSFLGFVYANQFPCANDKCNYQSMETDRIAGKLALLFLFVIGIIVKCCKALCCCCCNTKNEIVLIQNV